MKNQKDDKKTVLVKKALGVKPNKSVWKQFLGIKEGKSIIKQFLDK